MKKYLFFWMMFVSVLGYTQSVSLGLGGGANYSRLTHETDVFDQAFDYELGYFGGLVPTFHLGEKWAIVTELQYSVKKTKTSLTDFSGVYDMFYRYAYAEALPQIEFRPIHLIGFRIGGTVGYKLTETLKIGEQDWQKPVTELIKDADLGLTGGLVVHLGKLSIAGRYNLGLANLSDITFTDEQGVPIETLNLQNRGFQAGIYYFFF
jgi:hypothetical protein